MSKIADYLIKKPDLLSKYVSVGFTIVNKTLGPLNSLMQHLIKVQGIDPRTQPGDTARKALIKALDDVKDEEDFESDFNFAPALKAFEKTSAKFIHLTKEQFKKATDLTCVNDKPLPAPKTGVEYFPPKAPALQVSQEADEDYSVFSMSPYLSGMGKVSTNSLKEALEILAKYADRLDEPTEKVDSKREPTVVGKPKKSKRKSKIVKVSNKGLFRRVKNEDK